MGKTISAILKANEDWLMERVLDYAKRQNYTKYTSTLAEAWRVSIEGLSDAISKAWDTYQGVPELHPDDDYISDPVAAFGILEAKLHRNRGITLAMFLGLMKYYLQSYLDLVHKEFVREEDRHVYRLFIRRCFDRIEIGFCSEWSALTENQKMEDLRQENRSMTNEKNRYLTIFESASEPIILFNEDNEIENINLAGSNLLKLSAVSGQIYYGNTPIDTSICRLFEDTVKSFVESDKKEKAFDMEFVNEGEKKYYDVKMSKMLDVSGKFNGTVLIFNDLTVRKNFEHAQEKLICELKDAITNIKTLKGLIPICASCKKIRSDKGYWTQVEEYIMDHSEAEFTHGICPECMAKYMKDVERKFTGYVSAD